MTLLRTILILFFCWLPMATSQAQTSLDHWITGPHRSHDNIQRNAYRHPVETLTFFEVQPQHNVLEVWPGSGWYTEILAPYLKDAGYYVAAHYSPKQELPFFQNTRNAFIQKLKAEPDIYRNAVIASLYPPAGDDLPVPAESIDRVLTFRNVHNWSKGGFDQAMFDCFYKILKPGGILGVVEHRASAGTDFDTMIETGYMTEQYVIGLAQKSGFKLLATSEINANAKDTHQHPNGVWSLPPTLRGGEQNQAEYLAIGESDRMTLKFVKPEK